MTAPRGGDSAGFGRSTGDAALRGALLVLVAVVIGVLLLGKGNTNDTAKAVATTPGVTTTTKASGASGTSGATGATGASGTSGASGSSGSSGGTPTSSTHPVNQVKVLVTGNKATFYINDKKILETWGQPPPRGGAFGLFAQSDKERQNTWRFLDIVVVD